MKPKIISKLINQKFEDWCNSIDNEEVRKLVERNSIVTGGCIASMLLKEEVKDFDIYFRNKETAIAVAQYYVTKFLTKVRIKSHVQPVSIEVRDDEKYIGRVKIFIKSAGLASDESGDNIYKYFENAQPSEGETYVDNVAAVLDDSVEAPEVKTKTKYEPVFMSANAITLSDKIQIIIRFYGEHNEIHGNYDFVHCTNYWDSRERSLYLNQPALESLLSKELVYIGSKFPICSIIRIRKFIKRNWTINAGQMLKMCYQIGQLDLNDFSVLEDQLTGVDVAYFHQLIEALRAHNEKMKEKGNDFKLEYGYLAEIIDRIF